MSRIRVAVLMGGRSAEREVSLSTGRQVLQSLDPARYDAFPVDTAYLGMSCLFDPEEDPEETSSGSAVLSEARIGEDPLVGVPAPAIQQGWPLPLTGRNRPDVALICLHGRYGEDGTIQGMLELLDIPYTGSGVLASALAMDKVMSKKLFQIEGIPTPPAITIRGRAEADRYLAELGAGTAAVGCPSVVKPSRQGSTIGISIVQETASMAAALDTALAYDTEVLIEQFVQGIEITGPVLGNDDPVCLPLVEIVPSSGFYDYEAKYTPGATEEIVPARLSDEQTRLAQDLALRAHRALGCRGFSRTDMLVAADGIWVLEVNTIPGMTPTSLLPCSAEAAGLPFPRLLDRMIELALEGRNCEATHAAPI
jgi:D-alanine-D-alanine ligase